MQNLIILLLSTLIFVTSCNSDNKNENQEQKKEKDTDINIEIKNEIFIPDTITMYEGLPSNILKGAIFNDNITRIKLFHFSDDKSKDTFKLEIPKGQIEYSNSKVSIINSKGQYLYSVVFPTYFLREGYELMPDIPENLDSAQTQQFLNDFDKTLTKTVYENYYLKKVLEFLNKCAFEAQKSDYIFDPEWSIDNSVRKEILQYDKIICVSFPIHYGDEGTSYIGYSKKKNRAFVFAETD